MTSRVTWWILFLSAALMALLVHGTLQRASLDASMLDLLSLPPAEGMEDGFSSTVLRMVGTPPSGSPETAARLLPWLLGARDFFFLAAGLGLLAWVGRRFPDFSRWSVLLAGAGLVAYGGWRGFHQLHWWDPAASGIPDAGGSLMDAYAEARQLAGEAPVWVNLSAARWLPLFAGPWKEEWTAPGPEEAELLSRQAGNPRTWRLADRQAGYGAILLAGPPAEFRPLLDHLLGSPDWHLHSLYPYAMVFRRGTTPENHALWPQPEDLWQRYPREGARASYLARLAHQAAAINQPGEARRLFQQALELDSERAEVQALHASFLATRGQWEAASQAARTLLDRHPRYVPGWQVLVQAELAGGRPGSAWEASQTLLRLQPRDPYSLFLAARAAHEAGASYAEVEALERLIRVSRRRGLPLGRYYVYLGQAQARQGLADHARRSFETALASEELDPEATASVELMVKELTSGDESAGESAEQE